MKRLISLAATALLSACASIAPTQAPLLSPFGDGTQWIVWEDIEFVTELDDHTHMSIVVPRGFVTDLASTPRSLWSLYPPFGKYLSAAILHDYLYWRQACSPEEADKIIYQTMRDAGVDQATQSRFYVALRAAGDKAWHDNQTEKNQGLIRVIPPNYLNQDGGLLKPTTLWPDLRNALKKAKAKEPTPHDDMQIANACKALDKEIVVKSGISAVVWGR
ncbi:DUF1353 domain-containing protein [Methylomonas koyamae]|uniref:Uncharacterized protein n=1 Tax=Methylomonas koyamae TaxID=702114 RepID=A0A291II02_9GAMM|nr:DUF1353 domain-containing protein [Methylomonas koyamae]ATG89879.1 PF07087 family protein [Methylomonas koyamae]OAI29939.1 hypothetical protein A1356_22735 [Methylomonas koyamae]